MATYERPAIPPDTLIWGIQDANRSRYHVSNQGNFFIERSGNKYELYQGTIRKVVATSASLARCKRKAEKLWLESCTHEEA